MWPTASAFGLPRRERTYTTLLMATGLTFGSIAALFGYTHHFITRTQYTELVTVAVLSAFVPTIIAQQFFRPKVVDIDEEEALGAEDISFVHRRPADARSTLLLPRRRTRREPSTRQCGQRQQAAVPLWALVVTTS